MPHARSRHILLNHKHKSRGTRSLLPDTQNPSPLLKTVIVWDATIGHESLSLTSFPSSTKVKAFPMNGENRPLVTDEPVEFEK